MNHRLLGIAFAAVVLAACSGAAPQLVETPPEGGGGAVSPGGGSSGGTSGNPSGGGSGSPGQGGNGSSGGGSGSGGFDAGVAPTQCPSGGTEQTSSSGHSASDPTAFDTVACGKLASGESYYWTFQLPASTQTFGIAFTGGIRLELTLNGNTIDVVPGGSLPFKTGVPYYLRVTPLGTTAVSYVLVVTEK